MIEKLARDRLGFESLRPGQLTAVEALAGGRDALAVLPTGGGKSAIYEMAGLLRAGPTIVVSPLIAKPGSHTATQYTHYSTLRWIEDSFGLACLRHACDPGTTSFGTDIFKAPAAGKSTTPTS